MGPARCPARAARVNGMRRSPEELRVEQEREGRKILPVIRLFYAGVGPVAKSELHRGPFAGQLHPQSQLRSKVPVRGTEDVGFLSIGEPEPEIASHRTALQ